MRRSGARAAAAVANGGGDAAPSSPLLEAPSRASPPRLKSSPLSSQHSSGVVAKSPRPPLRRAVKMSPNPRSLAMSDTKDDDGDKDGVVYRSLEAEDDNRWQASNSPTGAVTSEQVY